MKAILENIAIDQEALLLAYQYSQDNFVDPLHFHPEYELVYILEGSGTRYVGDKIEPFEKGDLVLMSPNMVHCWKNEVGSSSRCQSLVIQWKPVLVDDRPELSDLFPLLQDSQRGLKIQASPSIIELMEKIIKERGLHQHILFLQLLYILSTYAHKRFICSSIRSQKITTTTSDRLNTIFSHIESNYQNKIHLQTLAKLVGLSESAFSRFFSKAMGKPFFSFLNEYRIQRVCKLLQEKDVTVSEACYLSGFDSLPFFHRQFKKYKSITPYHYKKEYGRSYEFNH
ncbi:AraC family transcriptional regulator [Saccharicrinis fermentans]|uniref:Bacillibactin transport regulator n=1 Tax=Saccharicrinis fermentans DSM 9555 = JCM 21142 TaxID=869213 RepID=W7YDA0_9BACT|nr:AraC family transcriptional regulator [Saccharicrinis fermentans]GAF02456.1 bacillibactin transport regulator [Saccharicrinis fermentans DSM 9555 = JCM 21142]